MADEIDEVLFLILEVRRNLDADSLSKPKTEPDGFETVQRAATALGMPLTGLEREFGNWGMAKYCEQNQLTEDEGVELAEMTDLEEALAFIAEKRELSSL